MIPYVWRDVGRRLFESYVPSLLPKEDNGLFSIIPVHDSIEGLKQVGSVDNGDLVFFLEPPKFVPLNTKVYPIYYGWVTKIMVATPGKHTIGYYVWQMSHRDKIVQPVLLEVVPKDDDNNTDGSLDSLLKPNRLPGTEKYDEFL